MAKVPMGSRRMAPEQGQRNRITGYLIDEDYTAVTWLISIFEMNHRGLPATVCAPSPMTAERACPPGELSGLALGGNLPGVGWI